MHESLRTSVFRVGLLPVVFAAALSACGGSQGSANQAAFPTASKLPSNSLPDGVTWHGVYFINSPGSRGTMHIIAQGDDHGYGCWIAEDKHSRAKFGATFKGNVAMFDWTETKIGAAGPPTRVSAYLVMSTAEDGRHKVKGEYGETLASDSGNPWEGIRQKGAEPKPDGCKVEEGETIPTETKPLE